MSETEGGFVMDVLRKRLVADWDPTQADGYDPTVSYDAPEYLSIHTGAYDDTLGFPQIAISTVGSNPINTTGIHGFNPGGKGVVLSSRTTLDINCWAGSEDDIDSGLKPEELADMMGRHVRDLVHGYHLWLLDPDTGDRVAQHVIPSSSPQTFPDPQALTKWRSLVEVTYDERRDPPDAA